jgi:hypothetical protein
MGLSDGHWRTPYQPSEQDFRQFDILAKQAADLIEGCKLGEESPQAQ